MNNNNTLGQNTRQVVVNGQQTAIKTETTGETPLLNSANLVEQKHGNKFVLTPDYIQQSKYIFIYLKRLFSVDVIVF